MSDIVKYDSLAFDDIRRDIEGFLSLSGEIDPADFNASSTLRRFSDALASIYDQIRVKMDNVRKESIMDSAVRPESIRYLAMSQMSYSPKRRIAPQHTRSSHIRFVKPDETVKLDAKGIIGNIEIDGSSYPISLLDGYVPIDKIVIEGKERTVYQGRVCIGSWKSKKFDLSIIPNYKTPYFNFRVEDDRDTIDDSGTVEVSVDYNKAGDTPVKAVSGLEDLMLYTNAEKRGLALVKNSFFGGLDVNFGDGIIYGNALYTSDEDDMGVPHNFTVRYLSTPGFIPNFRFVADNITWDNAFIDEVTVKAEDGEDEVIYPSYSLEVSNGISAETTQQIKTLSPYIAAANQRIMTNDDFISRVLRIPSVKSAYSRPRHISPGEPEAVSNLVPTATFELSGLTLKGAFPWSIEHSFATLGEDGFPVRKPDESIGDLTLRRAAYLKTVSESNIKYNAGDVAIHDGELHQLHDRAFFYKRRMAWAIEKDDANVDLEKEGWVKISADEAPEYQELTQIEWDLNYHQQYNFDKLLGFMRVIVIPPKKFSADGDGEPWDGQFEITVQLDPYIKGNLTPSEINQEIRGIILSYCWTLGAFLDVGEMVVRINAVKGVNKCYLESPVRNYQLAYNQYIKPVIDITYKTETVKRGKFGK